MGGLMSMSGEKEDGFKSTVVDDVPASSSNMENSNNSSGNILNDTLASQPKSKNVVVDAPLSQELFDHSSDDDDEEIPGLNDSSDSEAEDTFTSHQRPDVDVHPTNATTKSDASGTSMVEKQAEPSTAQPVTSSHDQEDLEGFYFFLFTYILRRSYAPAAARTRTAVRADV